MSMSITPSRKTVAGSPKLSPLDIVALEAALDPFCPVAAAGGQYRPELCLPWCSVCRDLLRERGGPCGKNGSPTSPTR